MQIITGGFKILRKPRGFVLRDTAKTNNWGTMARVWPTKEDAEAHALRCHTFKEGRSPAGAHPIRKVVMAHFIECKFYHNGRNQWVNALLNTDQIEMAQPDQTDPDATRIWMKGDDQAGLLTDLTWEAMRIVLGISS